MATDFVLEAVVRSASASDAVGLCAKLLRWERSHFKINKFEKISKSSDSSMRSICFLLSYCKMYSYRYAGVFSRQMLEPVVKQPCCAGFSGGAGSIAVALALPRPGLVEAGSIPLISFRLGSRCEPVIYQQQLYASFLCFCFFLFCFFGDVAFSE